MLQPLVSIIIAARKPTRVRHETVEAVEAQTLADLELIIIQDGSPDTLELTAALAGYRKVPNCFRQHSAAV
jgi:glycosyltransferase involved in cell wall biosynthesis